MVYLVFARPVNPAVVFHIIEQPGFLINQRDLSGATTLYYAANDSTPLEVWQLLVTLGTDLNSVDERGQTMLWWYLLYND